MKTQTMKGLQPGGGGSVATFHTGKAFAKPLSTRITSGTKKLELFLKTKVFLKLKNAKKNEIIPSTFGRGWHEVPGEGFTLAEVLITIGIIGIVAAITLPSLIQKHKNLEVESKLKKIYSVMNQAILRSELDNGQKEDWETCNFGQPDDESSSSECRKHFDKYILPYIKYTKIEEFEAAGRYNIAIFLTDGSVLVGKTHPKLVDYFFFPNGKNFDKDTFITQNENGSFQRADCGISYFAFQFCPSCTDLKLGYKKGFEPYSNGIIDYTEEVITGSHDYSCNKNSSYKNWCTALIQMNGWKIPDNYPFKVK